MKINSGNDFKIKANNNDALIYFTGLTSLSQKIKIDPNQVGKNAEIKLDTYSSYILDFGFKDSARTEILTYSYNYFENGGNIYVENIYDKLKVKLNKDEFFYLYYTSESFAPPPIVYSDNLNHKNNEYTFIYVPQNSKEKTLIISNGYKDKIRYQVNFCKSPHVVKMYYQDSESSKETLLEFNNEKTIIDKNIIKRAHKLRFDSNNDFIFSYSFIDYADTEINKSKKWKKEREILTNFTIEEIIKKYPDNNNSDIFIIKFKPNYKNSSTRYIIVIASNTKENTIENFNNPCYVTKIANEKPKLSKTINVVDIGENESIEIEVDIKDILGTTENYIVNIISQELRFEKKLNFYEPMVFTHRARSEDDDKEEEEEKEKEKEKEEEKEKDKNIENKGFSAIYVVYIVIALLIIIVIVLFLVIRNIRRKNQNRDFKADTKSLNNEKLLEDI